MKVAVVFACLVAVAAARSLADRQVMFEAFVKDYEREYSTEEERQFRFEVFSENLAKADLLNAQDAYATHGVTQFTDLTEEEFYTRYANLRWDGPSYPVENKLERANGAPQAAYDHTSKLGAIKNQGSCGSCWAFSTIAGIEGAYRLGRNEEVNLSEQQLLDCDSYDGACNGGLMHYAYKYYADVGGRVDGDDYKYQARKGSCQAEQYDQKASVSGYEMHCDAFTQGTPKCDEADMAKTGAGKVLDVAVDASAMMSYRSGIITSGCSTRLSHAVNIVGFGTEGGKDYWIVRNSWGGSWGEKGYCRFEYGAGRCGIDMYVGTAKL